MAAKYSGLFRKKVIKILANSAFHNLFLKRKCQHSKEKRPFRFFRISYGKVTGSIQAQPSPIQKILKIIPWKLQSFNIALCHQEINKNRSTYFATKGLLLIFLRLSLP